MLKTCTWTQESGADTLELEGQIEMNVFAFGSRNLLTSGETAVQQGGTKSYFPKLSQSLNIKGLSFYCWSEHIGIRASVLMV